MNGNGRTPERISSRSIRRLLLGSVTLVLMGASGVGHVASVIRRQQEYLPF